MLMGWTPTNKHVLFLGPPEKKTLCQESAWMLGTWPTLAKCVVTNTAIGAKYEGGNVVLDETSRNGENIRENVDEASGNGENIWENEDKPAKVVRKLANIVI